MEDRGRDHKLSEMERFRNLLDEAGIEWWDDSEMDHFAGLDTYMERTKFEHRGYRWSVIHGFGSYGGYDRISKDKGLLELMSMAIENGEPIGYLTAGQAMKLVRGVDDEDDHKFERKQ